ncbi:leukotriene-hydrolase [Acrasis kona]|uniref:Leukotriene-hydrolase n=1 Tax=Acrasis kona TaxID=1008807 RepID=A0AAW2ZNY0_9EUKA
MSSVSTGYVPQTSPNDPNSFANNHEVKATNYHLDLSPNFSKKSLNGFVDVLLEAVVDNPGVIILDARTLIISQVKVLLDPLPNHKDVREIELFDYLISGEVDIAEAGYPSVYGQPITVRLPQGIRQDFKKGSTITLRLVYETTPVSDAIQWLEKEQTLGKQHPYLFTQCQSVHARSLVPCQDTPSSKSTYSATIRVENPLVAVMSAVINKDKVHINEKFSVFHFEQKVPIPSYLIALAVGALKSREIGPRSRIWSEEELLDAGAYEFSETEDFIRAAEEFLPAYSWGIYDLLLLPPSFPYGGMENPCLTFVTPTLLAGDRSLANVVAHEISHSWSGNLVTNKNWEHFWLNEGFTVYLERRILAHMDENREQGEEFAKFHAMMGYQHLTDSVDRYRETNQMPFTKMVQHLDKVDPDDAFSSVPYEKGFNFLYYLEKQIVGDVVAFEKFLHAYFTEFANQSIETDQMKAFFIQYFEDKVPRSKLDAIEWDAWLHSEGDVLHKNRFESKLAESAIKLADDWVDHNVQDASKQDLKDWTSLQLTFIFGTASSKGSRTRDCRAMCWIAWIKPTNFRNTRMQRLDSDGK